MPPSFLRTVRGTVRGIAIARPGPVVVVVVGVGVEPVKPLRDVEAHVIERAGHSALDPEDLRRRGSRREEQTMPIDWA